MEKSTDFGESFEAFIHHELRTYVDYNPQSELHFWRSTTKYEVDFILNNTIAIEVKAKSNIAPKDLKGLKALQEEELLKKYIVVSLETINRRVGEITIMPWREFLNNLWDKTLLD